MFFFSCFRAVWFFNFVVEYQNNIWMKCRFFFIDDKFNKTQKHRSYFGIFALVSISKLKYSEFFHLIIIMITRNKRWNFSTRPHFLLSVCGNSPKAYVSIEYQLVLSTFQVSIEMTMGNSPPCCESLLFRWEQYASKNNRIKVDFFVLDVRY